MSKPLRIGLVSISDRASSGVYEDKGLPSLREWLHATISTPIELVERLVEGLHAMLPTLLHGFPDSSDLTFGDQVGDKRRAHQDLDGRHTFLVDAPQQSL